MRSYVHEKTRTRMFTAALFVISLRVSPRLRERSTGVHRAQVFGTSGPGFPGKLSWGPDGLYCGGGSGSQDHRAARRIASHHLKLALNFSLSPPCRWDKLMPSEDG